MLTFFKSLLTMVGLFFLSQLPAMALAHTFFLNHQQGSRLSHPLLLLITSIVVVIFLLLSKKLRLFSSIAEGQVTSSPVKVLVLAYFGIIAGNFLSTWILALEGETTTVNQAALTELLSVVPKEIFLLMAVLIAPLLEELIFRAFATHYLFPKKPLLGLILGSLIFTLVHTPTNIGSFLSYGTMSAMLALVYWKTKDIKYSIGLHFFNNVIASIGILFFPF